MGRRHSKNHLHVLDNIPLSLDFKSLVSRLRLTGMGRHERDFSTIFSEAETIARPQFLYMVADACCSGEDSVVLGGVGFTSRTLRETIGDAEHVFPFAATCGGELAEWAASITRLLHRYWADVLMEEALNCALGVLERHIASTYQVQTCCIEPGIPDDWPVTELKKLFILFGDATEDIGLKLGRLCMMSPIKSVSGLRFPAVVKVEKCTRCTKRHCHYRSAPIAEEEAPGGNRNRNKKAGLKPRSGQDIEYPNRSRRLQGRQ